MIISNNSPQAAPSRHSASLRPRCEHRRLSTSPRCLFSYPPSQARLLPESFLPRARIDSGSLYSPRKEPPLLIMSVCCFPPLSPIRSSLLQNRSARSPGGGGGGAAGGALRDASVKVRSAEKLVVEKARNPPDGGDGAAELSVMYDDEFGTMSFAEYFAGAMEICKPDGGPPRWFCPVECGKPIRDPPLLLFLPGADGSGFGLVRHHKSLGRVFEVRCLHIPVYDRTPFEGLVDIVENSVKHGHAASPNRPIYLVGDSFGGCLALAVAVRNPTVDLVLVLANPATSFERSPLQPFLSLLRPLPSDVYATVPYLLSFISGDPVRMAMTSVAENLPFPETLLAFFASLRSMALHLSDLANILPKETLLWKLQLLETASKFVNSRLNLVEAEVLLLVSGKDNLVPSGKEADRLMSSLKNCRVRYFPNNGHTLLLEDGINLLTVIKGTCLYRRSNQTDYVTNYLPPSLAEYRKLVKDFRLFQLATSPVMFSTMRDGRIVRGFDGVPDEGPVLFVGNHMLLALEVFHLYNELVKEKRVALRSMAHPIIFDQKFETSRREMSIADEVKVFGALPVSATNMYRLLSTKSFVLLYPGGVREGLHRKGEEYKLFWPSNPEFVRMAARFDATIVPFGVVGEDDVVELVLDYDDLMSYPITRQFIEEINTGVLKVRAHGNGEAGEGLEVQFVPGLLPKIPGRFYYLFGKPIETRGKDVLRSRGNAMALYLQIKLEVERMISYLKAKREEDPYRSLIARTIYEASCGFTRQASTIVP